jgi:predicted hydrocarbon binding protein
MAKQKNENENEIIDEKVVVAETNEAQSELTEKYFAVSVLRDFVLPDLLDKDTPELLYWAGKDLSRRLAISDMNDLPRVFNNAGFGDLSITNQSKGSYKYKLSGPEVIQRFNLNNDNPEFSLEAGFISETVQNTIGSYCMGSFTLDLKNKAVNILIQIERN